MPKKLPSWAEDTLQGLCYWLGHRYAYYRHYPLGESAITGECCNLLSAKLNKDERLYCEILYKNISSGKIDDSSRTDLVITDNKNKKSPAKKDISEDVKYVIEVKRAAKGKGNEKLLKKDLYRLHNLLQVQSSPQIRCFLLAVSQKFKPKLFVTDDGCAIKGTQSIELNYDKKTVNVKYAVRRVCKATHTFDKDRAVNHSFYAILVEIMRPNSL